MHSPRLSPRPSPPSPRPKLPVPTEHFTHKKLFALTSALIGIQVCWAVQVGYVTKSFLTLGLAERYVSYAWLAGPIAGIVVQPVVGVLSDRCTSAYGRRRPFLAAGTALTTVCLLLFAYAGPLGRALGDPVSQSDTIVVAPRGIAIGLAAFWALDFSINAAQGPLRALLADVVPPEQHSTGNSYFALATGLGNCFGSLLGAVHLTKMLPFFPDDIQALFSIAALLLVICVTTTLVAIKETPLPTLIARAQQIEPLSPSDSPRRRLMYDSMDLEDGEKPEGGGAPAATAQQRQMSEPAATTAVDAADAQRISFFEAARVAPDPFWAAFTTQCFSWFGWFTLFVFGTSWVGAEVANGSFTAAAGTPSREVYDAGVRMGNLGLGLQSVVTILTAPLLPGLIRRSSNQAVYLVASLVLAFALSTALVLTRPWQQWLATAAFALTGFPWAVTMTVPWSLMSEAVTRTAPERSGIYSTMFNLSQCFPEVLVSLVASRVVAYTGKQASVLGLGGVCALIAAGCIVALGVGRKRCDEADEAGSRREDGSAEDGG